MSVNANQQGDVVTLTWATTSPTAGDPVIKCAAKATGGIAGVARNGVASAGESIEVVRVGAFDLTVITTATLSIGDTIFADVGGIEVCTATLGNDASGLPYGTALEAMTAASTAVISVLLGGPLAAGS